MRHPPRYAVPLLGREADMATLLRRMTEWPGLVTVAGPAGCGKTRLAAAFAHAWCGGRGPWWVDLQTARTAVDLTRAVAWTLGVRSGDLDLGAAVGRDGRPLLVLDNLEQLTPDAIRQIDTWLHDVPQVRLLGTSRRPLGLAGERVHELAPLPIPTDDTVLTCAAWRLFTAYAPEGSTESTPPRTAQKLLRALDGIPLAIQLAAGRLEVLSIEGLLERIDDALDILADPLATSERQASLRGAVAWSWDLLSDQERSALSQAGMFRAPFRLDAAEAVIQVPGASVLDVLHMLIRRHLVVRHEDRLRLLESVRQFAGERLEPDIRTATMARHAEWWSGWVRQQTPMPESDDRHALPELLAVLERGEAGQVPPRQAARCGTWASDILQRAGQLEESIGLVERCLALDLGSDTALRSRIHLARGSARRRLGRSLEAQADFELAVSLARAGHDRATLARGLLELATRNHGDERLSLLREARAHAEADADPSILAAACVALADHTARAADLPRDPDHPAHREAMELIVEGRRMVAHFPDSWSLMQTEKQAGGVLWGLRELDRAREALDHAGAIARTLGYHYDEAWIIAIQGYIAEYYGNGLDAASIYADASEKLARHGAASFSGYFRGTEGRALVQAGRVDEGIAKLRASLDGPRHSGPDDMWLHHDVVLALAEAHLEGRARPVPDFEPQSTGAWAVPLLREGFAAARAGDVQRAEALADRLQEGLVPETLFDMHLLVIRTRIAALRSLARTWRVERAGSWLQSPGGPRQAISPDSAPSRILACLAAQRLETPGVPVAREQLFEAGWPGERAMPSAAGNRVRVTLAALRSSGLRAILQRRGHDGWLLDPSIPLELV